MNNKLKNNVNSTNIIASQSHGNQAWFWGTNATSNAPVTSSVSHVSNNEVLPARPMSSPLSSLTTTGNSSPTQVLTISVTIYLHIYLFILYIEYAA